MKSIGLQSADWLQGEEVVMYLVLPTEEADGLESLIELEGKLANTSLFSRLVDSMTRKSTNVQLPRFRLQQKLNLKVNELLET